MADIVTNELIYETLKKVQDGVADLKRDLREVKLDLNGLRGMVGDLIKTNSRRDTSYISLESRVERIEARLDLHEPI